MNATIPLSPEARQRIFGRRSAPPEPPQPPAPPDDYLAALNRSHGQRHAAAAALLQAVNAGKLASHDALAEYAGIVRHWHDAPVADGWRYPPAPGDTDLHGPSPYTGQPDMTREAGPPGKDFSPWMGAGYSEQQERAFRKGFREVVETVVDNFNADTWGFAKYTLQTIGEDIYDAHKALRYQIKTMTAEEGEQAMNQTVGNLADYAAYWGSAEMKALGEIEPDALSPDAPEAPADRPAVLTTPMAEARTRDLEIYRDAVTRELARRGGDADIEGVPLDMIASMPIDPSKILLVTDGVRYLSRGNCLLFVGPSGVGKSTATTQAFIFLALGRPAFGIAPARPLKIVVVQAENDSGDLTAMTRALFDGAGLTAAERAIVGQQVRLISHNSTCGPAFLAYLEQVVEKHHPDLIVIDPLMAYAGGDLTKTEVVASFCRNGLNPIATRYGVGLVVVHHTPKLTNQNSNASARRNYGAFDWQYAAAGSADLANWARAMLVVEPLSGDVIALRAAKRWPGWLDPGGAQQYVRYFRREREPGRIFWHDAAPGDVAAARSEKSDGPSDQSLAEHRTSALGLVEKEPLPVAAFDAAFMRKTGLGRQRARDVRAELEHDGTLAMSRREPARDGRKYIGTLETIRELEAKWATPNLPGV